MPRKTSMSRRRTNPWLQARRISQGLTLAIFLFIFLAIGQWGLRQPASALPFLFDPFAMTTYWLSGHAWLPASLLALLTILLTLLIGRAWCGWICPLGTLFDIFPSKKSPGFSGPQEKYRKIKHILLVASLSLALFGSLVLLILDPLALVFRSLTTVIWPLFNTVVTAIERGMYHITLLKGLVNAFEGSIRPLLFPETVLMYRFSMLFAVILTGIFLLNLISERFWCRYICPLGSGLGLISRFALVKRQVGEQCSACGMCAKGCPTGTIDPQNGYRSDPAECTVCLRCLDDCPLKLTHFSFSPKPAGRQAYDPSRRDVFRTVGLSAAAIFLMNLERQDTPNKQTAHRILPPGASADSLYSKCIRCSECLRVCPTGGLQPAITESGLAGLWTPVLVPRVGHCEYACNACGQVCPTQAIQPLSLEEKHATIIGYASIDTSRCIAWSERLTCIFCQEVCPLPEKAIILEAGLDINGRPLKLPRVVSQRCIGCGTCEKNCPVAGPAAIRVFTSRDGV